LRMDERETMARAMAVMDREIRREVKQLESGEFSASDDESEDSEDVREQEEMWEQIGEHIERTDHEERAANAIELVGDEEDYVRPEFDEEANAMAPLPSIVDTRTQDKVTSQDLASQLRDGYGGIRGTAPLVVDVRDDEYSGGHIEGAQHYPSSSFEHRLDELCDKIRRRCALRGLLLFAKPAEGPSVLPFMRRKTRRALPSGTKHPHVRAEGRICRISRRSGASEHTGGGPRPDVLGAGYCG